MDTENPATDPVPPFSILIPARNEERLLPGCLEAIRLAAGPWQGQYEMVVILNRCTDRTEAIARDAGARIVYEDAPNLSLIRNAGAAAARGEVLVTVDADSRMTRGLLMDIMQALANPRVVGGGVWIQPERLSIGIGLTALLLLPLFWWRGISCGCFWCRREDFLAIGGFDTAMHSAEDIDFAMRLRAHGRKTGRRFRTMYRNYIRTSCRKFDHFGDWYLIRHVLRVPSLLRGTHAEMARKLWYDFGRQE